MNIEGDPHGLERQDEVTLWKRVGAQGSRYAGLHNRGRWNLADLLLFLTLLFSLLAFILAIVALAKVKNEEDDDDNEDDRVPIDLWLADRQRSAAETAKTDPMHRLIHTDKTISKIAFGSCTTYYLYPQPVWTEGVIPSEPDAWFWLGDLVYMDNVWVDCKKHPNASVCNCEMTLHTHPPYACLSGNLTHAREKTNMQLLENNYREFLTYMCPESEFDFSVPPEGAMCLKPILGIYDDHDYGVNNANKHLQNKFEFKNLFLDALGEPQDSVRRSSTHGLEMKYTLNPDSPLEQQIDVFALDERYERESLPCKTRRRWCRDVLRKGSDPLNHDYLWCDDFLHTGGPFGMGSCCSIDEKWANGWCRDNMESDDPLWDVACNSSSARFGSMLLEVDNQTNALIRKENYDADFADILSASTFCEVLGSQQRRWLQNGLEESQAPLKLVLSGSVVFGNPVHEDDNRLCSGDDWECYKVAQENLVHTLGSVETGCVIILAGDYHMADLKMLEPGADKNYSQHYPSSNFKKPIYQIMSSGLTPVTASTKANNRTCSEDSWRRDSVGLRPYGPCSFVIDPSFGMMEVDWEERTVVFQHRSIKNGSVLFGFDGSKQELVVNLDSCQMVR